MNQTLELTRGVAVKGKTVDGVAGEAGDRTRDGSALDIATEIRRRLLAEKGQKVSAEAGDKWGSHRGAVENFLISCILTVTNILKRRRKSGHSQWPRCCRSKCSRC